MYYYYNALQTKSGDVLPDYLVRLFTSPGGDAVDIFADDSGTPIATASGVANAAKADSLGMVRFWVPNGTYDIAQYDTTDTFKGKETGVPLFDAGALTADLSAETGATLVGTDGGDNVQEVLDAANSAIALRPTSATLAASGGADLVGFSHAVTYADDTLGQRLKQEIWVTDAPYNADPTGAADASAGIAAAILALPATGGTLRFGPGTFKCNFTLPAEPKVVNVIGSGFGATKLIQNTADTPIIAKVAGVSRIIGSRIEGLTVVPHADSLKSAPANILIDIAGFDWSCVNVDYEANSASTATEGRAYAVVAGHANGIPCYNNKISVKAAQTDGPEKVVWFHNNGGSSLSNPNVNVVSIWSYALDTCVVGADAADSTQTTVRDSLFEDCPGMTGVIAGNFTKTQDNWFELIDVAINYGETADTTANNCVSSHDQFSGANTIVINSNVAGPPRFEAPLFGTMTFENQSAAASTNYVLPTLAKAIPTVPAVSWLLIGATTVTDAAAVRLNPDHHGVVTTMASYTATPLGTGRDALSITPPSGYEIMNATVGIEEIGVGVRPVALSSDTAGKNYIVYWPNTNAHNMSIRVTMRATS